MKGMSVGTSGIMRTMKQIMARDGVRGFYSGIGVATVI